MPAGSVSPSADGRTSITIPAQYAEDFRAAITEEIALQAKFVRSDQKKAIEWEASGDDDRAAGSREDARHGRYLLAGDAALLGRVGREGTDELQIRVTDADEAGMVAHALEVMARKIVGRRIKRSLSYSPIDGEAAPGLVELAARLMWTVERSAEWHQIALGAEQEAAR
jgi:hypothetical protein